MRVFYHTILSYTVHTIPCCTILCYAMLYCIAQDCTIHDDGVHFTAVQCVVLRTAHYRTQSQCSTKSVAVWAQGPSHVSLSLSTFALRLHCCSAGWRQLLASTCTVRWPLPSRPRLSPVKGVGRWVLLLALRSLLLPALLLPPLASGC